MGRSTRLFGFPLDKFQIHLIPALGLRFQGTVKSSEVKKGFGGRTESLPRIHWTG